jgi:hypothetical protein
VALAHQGAGGGELVLVALRALSVDQVSDIEQHLSVIEQPAANFLIERLEEPVHLEAHCASSRLPFARS